MRKSERILKSGRIRSVPSSTFFPFDLSLRSCWISRSIVCSFDSEEEAEAQEDKEEEAEAQEDKEEDGHQPPCTAAHNHNRRGRGRSVAAHPHSRHHGDRDRQDTTSTHTTTGTLPTSTTTGTGTPTTPPTTTTRKLPGSTVEGVAGGRAVVPRSVRVRGPRSERHPPAGQGVSRGYVWVVVMRGSGGVCASDDVYWTMFIGPLRLLQ